MRMTGTKIATERMLARLVAFDTTSSESNLPFIDAVADYLDGYGIEARRVPNATLDKANLFATIGPPGDGGVVLSGHSDCVPVEGQTWSSDPFEATTRRERIYGRGTCDMKGFIAAALALVPEMLAARLRRPLHLAISYDEEVGCTGIPSLLEKLSGELPKPAVAVVGEPTEMTIISAHKGIYGFETAVSGLEAHSSVPHLGASAIVPAAEIVQFLNDMALEFAANGPFDDAFAPPFTTVNVGTIVGGTAVNIVPKRCRIGWEFRPVPRHEPAVVRERLDRFLRDRLLERLRLQYPEASIETKAGAAVPPLVASADSPAEALVRRVACSSGPVHGVSFATEAGLFQRAGIPAVVIGPGSIEQAHKPDEYVSLEQLRSCEAFLRGLVADAAG